MYSKTHLKGAALAAFCALTLAACESGIQRMTSPSAVVGAGGAASNPDGSLLKVTAPVAIFPLNAATGVSVTPMLSAQPGVGRFATPSMTHRFQLSTAENFDPVLQTGAGTLDSQLIVRFTVGTAIATGTKVFWRVRVEQDDLFGPWSNVLSFTTTGTVVPPPQVVQPGEKRTPNPAPGQQLPLPDMRGELAKFNNASDSCPLGIKYVPNPWQNRVIDHFRTFDTRWGYNAKPTRTAADNNGTPVVAAGDEAAYNFSAENDQGTTRVHLVDLLVQHCGTNPVTGWRVFTGEEPGRWTGAGRF
jgi:hypothetical protein